MREMFKNLIWKTKSIAQTSPKRLPPDVRKNQILEAASELVEQNDLADFTMAAVAVKSGVSTPLVYKYFPNRSELLRKLLIFELNRIDQFLEAASASAKTLEAFVRRIANAELQTRMKQYVVIQKITQDAQLDRVITETYEKQHQIHMDYLSKRMSQATGLPQDLTLIATQLNLGISRAAIPLVNKPSVDLQYLEDIIVDMIMANVSALAVKYGTGPLRDF